ncbi:MAG TPA: branched-chain amino acid ABC transporter permease [Candidatus Cybelea sp.]|nr:branched-chain amino acid ABC transporter permease [Candidatus Cybelea sp.]
MLTRVLSGDPPGDRSLTVLLLVVAAGLLLAPFILPGVRTLNVAANICVFVVLVASYDLLLGYTGIVSFAHTMFFGLGGYGVAIALTKLGPGWGAVLLGAAAALIASVVLALLIGLFSLRVKAIFFAMITLAVASAFAILASQLSWLTGGEDGLTYQVPRLLQRGFRPFGEEGIGAVITGRTIAYYVVFFAAAALFLFLLRVVNSPFGRVLLSIRENAFRAEALGYRTVIYRTVANCIAAAVATLAGALLALWLGYNGPDTTLSFNIMIDVLLMVVIGGMGTLYGAVLGATVLIVAQNYLQDLMRTLSTAAAGVPLLANLVQPDRWLLWLGILFILSVYFFPFGIVGRLRMRRRHLSP